MSCCVSFDPCLTGFTIRGFKAERVLAYELRCLREEFKQIRDFLMREDCDWQQAHVNALIGEFAKYREYIGKLIAQLDTLTTKTKALEICCFV